MSFLARATAAGGGGVLLYTGFAPRTLWWLAPIGFAVLGWVLHGRCARAGLGYGFLFGLGFAITPTPERAQNRGGAWGKRARSANAPRFLLIAHAFHPRLGEAAFTRLLEPFEAILRA